MFPDIEKPLTIGDVLPYVEWREAGPNYQVHVDWKFRGRTVGSADFTVEPIIDDDGWNIYWISLQFIEEWQSKGLYTEIVKQFVPYLGKHGVRRIYAHPWDAVSEQRLASQGFRWIGPSFALDVS